RYVLFSSSLRPPRASRFPYTTLFRSGALGKNVTLLKADVMQPGEMERVRKEILPRLKRIDVLVNTVGGYMAGAVEETSVEDFDRDRKSTRLNSSHGSISYAVFCLKKK